MQIWQPLVGPVVDMPLGFCDASSVDPVQDLVACDLLYANRVGHITMVVHNPQQRCARQ
jgi:hypothetical protein